MPENTGRTAVFLAVNATHSHTNPAGWTLGRSAQTAGWTWQIVEATPREPVQPLLLRLAQPAPDVLAASFFLFNRNFLLDVMARYKCLHPECLLLGGGPEFLGDNRAFLRRHPFLDAVIRGEGEAALPDFLARWNQPERWHEVQGVCARFGGADLDTGTARLPDLNAIPPATPADWRRNHKPFLLAETSRGCAGQCVFCTSGAGAPPTRHFPIARAREELRRLQATGLPEVRLADRTFNEAASRCILLLRMFRDEFPSMRFHLEIDPGRLTPAIMQEFAEARPGQLYLELGVQTLTAAVFQNLGRAGALEAARAATRQLCAMPHLQTHVDLLAGLPGGTLAMLRADLQALVEMRPAAIQLEILKLLPGTALASDRERWGLCAAPTPPYEILATSTMAPADMETARQWSCLADWFYNQPDLQAVTSAAAGQLPEFWPDLAAACQAQLGLCDAPSLENRFRIFDDFLQTRAEHAPNLRHRLHYARLRHSLSHGYGMDVQPWKKPLPAGARLVEGHAVQALAQVWAARLDRQYYFVYTRDSRRAAAIYVKE